MTFREVRSAHQPEVNQFGQTSIGRPEYSVHSASSHTTPAHAAPRVPLLQGRITNPLSDQTPVPGPALHPHPQGTSTDYPRLLLLVCRLVKLNFGIASTASGAISCCAFTSTGGERAGAIAGAVVGSPTCASICRTVAGSVIKPIRRTRPPHPLHLSANTP